MKTVVHVTHEVVQKVGGIGAVLQGFFTSKDYNEGVGRSVLVGPLMERDGSVKTRLGKNGEVFYSTLDDVDNGGWGEKFHHVQETFGVGIVYGRRTFEDKVTGNKSQPEVILIDIANPNHERLEGFKRTLLERFGIQSNLYHTWEYEQYVRLAEPAIEALKVIGVGSEEGAAPPVILAHEFMGMPTALAAISENNGWRTIFYAHEVATMRRIVEGNTGHDTMFYNVLSEAMGKGKYVEDIFGYQLPYFKHALVSAAKFCDAVFCVGDSVVKEMKFLDPDFDNVPMSLVYNGLPAYEISVEEKLKSKQKLQDYCHEIMHLRPDYIFTHVTRMAISKGMWRDLKVLWHMEEKFQELGKTAVFFLLSSELGGPRKGHEVRDMEDRYSWPVAHKEGYPDLSGGEADFYVHIQKFNTCARNTKVIFVNQFGWSRASCGEKMPVDMDFMDIRKGSDVEFGQSIYEPFGIAQLEPLSFGGICVISNICGCAGFVKKVSSNGLPDNVVVADYTRLPEEYRSLPKMLSVGSRERNTAEEAEAKHIAEVILQRLPKSDDDLKNMIAEGYGVAKQMSWDVVMRDYFLPAVDNILAKN